eukprot:TRINITY_DN9602_c0_g2_i1.p1 TRINITY_DN9602_c0_g2~~TRINITY_DN9602_c0_g2_i1.p1  ORF type:complete len:477 (+),score=141.87 TRINITY_DN9602_c0_g2_i1:141-1571(+)
MADGGDKKRARTGVSDATVGHHDVASGPDGLGKDGDYRLPLPDRGDRRHAFWERQMHALLGLVMNKGMITTDEMRRCIEALEPEVYNTASYYERWAMGITTALLERGTFTNTELEAALGSSEPEPAVPFADGSVVRVRESSHLTRWRKPHLRSPGYVHGVIGTISRCNGVWPCPERRAFGGGSRGKQPLYSVSFDWHSVCDYGDDAALGDQVTAEIYHSWLEPSTQADLDAQREAVRGRVEAHRHSHSHSHGHGHSHSHGRDCFDHKHEPRSVVEQKAVDAELPCPPIAAALVRVLSEKGCIDGGDLRAAIEKVDSGDRRLGEVGRRVVAKAWVDPEFKARLLKDANAACAELGIHASNLTAPTQVIAVECTPEMHHVIACTLCSCYPLSLLGLSPDWYKSREFRSRIVREPRAVLKEFGTTLAPGQSVSVHDSTADCRYIVLPRRPAGTEGWPEEKLREVITRDSMIGVTVLPSA